MKVLRLNPKLPRRIVSQLRGIRTFEECIPHALMTPTHRASVVVFSVKKVD